jgi:hypothetical protein
MTGTDDKIHTDEFTADSLFDAVGQAIKLWSGLWWYVPSANIEVRAGEQRWKVSQDRVRRWRPGWAKTC